MILRHRIVLLVSCVLVALAAGVPARGAEPTPQARKIAEQVRYALDAQLWAWNQGDLDSFCSVYADDATFVSPKGITQGRRQVLERYRVAYPTFADMGLLSLEVLELRASPGHRPDARSPAGASVLARWTLDYADREDRTGLTLLVLHYMDGQWRIVQDVSM
jgi:ketosteroid isomerase-like protein